jgi:1,4-dihydroxy-2-naphthoyl-CoA hydrolase
MAIWKKPFTIDELNKLNANTLVEHLGILFTAYGDDYLEATMPVDHRTTQVVGLLHGGASVVLGESIGSIASYLCTVSRNTSCVGVEVNANHLKSARSGFVTGRVTALRIGSRLHVWDIRIRDASDALLCAGRLTVSVSEKAP